jgi:hypothetical protein
MAEENIVIKIKADIGITKEVIEAVTKAMEGLGKTATIVSGNVKVTNKNLEDTNKILGQVAQTAGKATGAIGGAGDAVKKSNQQWTNLALVIQDLPYGFRGIQNNLPALVGGLAGMTGGIYFAASAIIAFFTAYDMGVFGATKSNEAWKKSIKETNDELKNSVNYTTSEISNLQGLIAVMTDVNTTEAQRKKALDEVREAITKVDESEGKKITGLYSAITAVNLYTEAIQQQQMQEVIGKRIAEISLDQIEKRNKLSIETRKSERGIHPLDFFMGNQELTNLQSAIIANETLIRQLEELRIGNTKALLSNPFSKFNAKGQTGAQNQSEANQRIKLENETNLQVLQSKQQTYKDDILLFKDYEIKIIDLKEKLALAEANALGASELVLQNIRDIANNNRLKARQELSAKIKKLIEDDVKEEEKAEKEKEKISNKFINAFNSDINQQESDFNQFYKTKMNLSTGDLEGQKEILLQQRAQLEEGLALQAISWDTYTKGVGQNVKDVALINAKITKEAFDSLMQMGNGIMNALGPSLDMLIEKGENIGEVLTAAFHSIIRQLAKVIISAAIAVGLMAILFPGKLATAGGAGAVFKGLIGQGMGIGGIIGGGNGGRGVDATNGTNAINAIQNNPANNNNGEFVLKGNDLVLALQRSNSSLNLRRGGI